MRVLWYLVGNLRKGWGNFGRKLGKNYLILERLVGETFMNQWKNSHPKMHANSNKKLPTCLSLVCKLIVKTVPISGTLFQEQARFKLSRDAHCSSYKETE